MILVTGGAGFIGKQFCKMLDAKQHRYLCFDKLTYASDISELKTGSSLFVGDIGDASAVKDVFSRCRPEAVVHFAAETHVTRSIADPGVFMRSNVMGTFTLLDQCLHYWRRIEGFASRMGFRFVHISTDEVFGSLPALGLPFTEDSPYRPSTPYAASKAASDHLVKAFNVTYGLPTITLNATNNYGPGQHPEKLIPLVIEHALAGKPIPVHGDGSATRDWLHVEDFCRAIYIAITDGAVGESYVVGARQERMVMSVVEHICTALDFLSPKNTSYRDQITFVENRLGNDHRYAVNPSKIERLGWSAPRTFDLRETITWYLNRRALMVA